MLKHKSKLLQICKGKAQKLSIYFFVVFRYWLNQNNSKIQLINLASLTFLDFEVIFMRLRWDDVYNIYLHT